ncbi:methyl farnesoate epoxidase-like isoform X1 [Lycorma delicatula]|uniref:methyl farnesoate epoxidase-like isoform X1 n=2 Tax=Lycorma delicatula TaxID=130591 RepID=UPI003F51143C
MIFYIVLVIFILLIYIDTRKPAYYPPGPQWMPLVGNYLQFRQLLKQYKLTHRVWEKLASKYGSLLGLCLGSDRLVIVSGYKMICEVLNKEEFEGRPDGFFFRLHAFGQKLGVAFIDGPIGQDQRRFSLQNLKSFGFGRSAMEQRIILETSELVSGLKIKCKDEKSLRTDCMFGTSILNTIWTMLAGQRYDLDDERLKELLLSITKLFRIVDMSGGLINKMPFIRFIAPGKMKYYEFVNISNKLNGFLRQMETDEFRVRMQQKRIPILLSIVSFATGS